MRVLKRSSVRRPHESVVDRLNRPSFASRHCHRANSALGSTRLLQQIRKRSKCRYWPGQWAN